MSKARLFLLLIPLFTLTHSFSQNWTDIKTKDYPFLPDGDAYTTCYDIHGNIYAAGTFVDSGKHCYVAKYNGVRWAKLGGNINNATNAQIRSISADLSGNIYAAGNFKNSYGHQYVAKYDGTSWTELGGVDSLAANGDIYSVFCDSAGNVYAAGNFINPNGKHYVAMYDGNKWTELGGPNSLAANDIIFTLCNDKLGNLYAAGSFTNSTGKIYVAKWNGYAWDTLGVSPNSSSGGPIKKICTDNNGNLYAVGNIYDANLNYYVAKFDGTSWSKLGGPNSLLASTDINLLACDAAGNVYTGGRFNLLGWGNKDEIYKYNGVGWSILGANRLSLNRSGVCSLMSTPQGEVFVTAFIDQNAAGSPSFMLKYSQNSWIEVGGVNYQGTNSEYCYTDKYGNVYVTGNTKDVGGNYTVYKYDGSIWSSLGGYHSLALNFPAEAICGDDLGNIYVAGRFQNTSGKYYVAKFDGTNWSELGGLNSLGVNGYISSLCVDKNNNVYASGGFEDSFGYRYIAKYDGNHWTELGGSTNPIEIALGRNLMCVDTLGNVYIVGNLKNTLSKYSVAKFDGTQWSTLPYYSRLAEYGGFAISCDKKGNIYIPVYDSIKHSFGIVAKFDGSNWSELGSPYSSSAFSGIMKITTDNNGDIYAIGDFTYTSNKSYVAKYRNHNWVELGNLTQNVFHDVCNKDNSIYVLANDQNNIYDANHCLMFDYQCPATIPITTLNDTINCRAYTLNGRTYTTSGFYTDTLTTSWGCDSIIKLNLTITSMPLVNLLHVNAYDSFFFKHQWLVNSGNYVDTVVSFFGCDSIIKLNLSITRRIFIYDTICGGRAHTFGGQTIYYDYAGLYRDSIAVGSDTVVYLYLTVLQASLPRFGLLPDPNVPHNWFIVNQSWIYTTPVTYVWTWGDGSSSTGATPSHTYSSPGYYNLGLTIIDGSQCTNSHMDTSFYLYRMSSANTMVTVNVVNSIPTSIKDPISKNYSVYVVPNPNDGEFSIVGLKSDNVEINIFSYDGRLQKTFIGKENQVYQIPDLSSGIYFLQIKEPDIGTKTIKLEKH